MKSLSMAELRGLIACMCEIIKLRAALTAAVEDRQALAREAAAVLASGGRLKDRAAVEERLAAAESREDGLREQLGAAEAELQGKIAAVAKATGQDAGALAELVAALAAGTWRPRLLPVRFEHDDGTCPHCGTPKGVVRARGGEWEIIQCALGAACQDRAGLPGVLWWRLRGDSPDYLRVYEVEAAAAEAAGALPEGADVDLLRRELIGLGIKAEGLALRGGGRLMSGLVAEGRRLLNEAEGAGRRLVDTILSGVRAERV